MVDRTKCKEGGEHDFNDNQEDAEYDYELVTSACCRKCHQICQHEILRWDGTYDYEDCIEDECTGSEDGHSWNTESSDWFSPDKYYVDKCDTCYGTRKWWFMHKRTEYTDSNGDTI